MQKRPKLEDLHTIALNIGEVILEGYYRDIHIQTKGNLDLVTEIDHKVEKIAIEYLRSLFPHDMIITEESGEIGSHSVGIWYMDPLDGTINYAHKNPFFSFSLGYVINGVPTLGVIYDPLRKELFSAELGKGAFLNEQKISVSKHKHFNECLLVNEFSNHPLSYDKTLADIRQINQHVQGIRRPGSCALDLCYVAAGRYDGFWTRYASAWDFAGGSIICQEAGAKVTTVQGTANFLNPPCSILAAPHEIHQALLNVLNP